MMDLGRPPASVPVSAAVLVGGRSRRMGEPKALLQLEPGGPTMIELVVNALGDVAADTFLVGQPTWTLPASVAGMRAVVDDGQGAADGVIAALAAARHDLCLVVGCDMPFLDAALLRELGVTAYRQDRSVLASDRTGRHPLHAVYRRVDHGRIAALVDGGERSLTRIAAVVGAIAIDVDAHDTRRWSVFNVNTPADLATARAHARGISLQGLMQT